MAYDINMADAYSARANHSLRLYVRRYITDDANNRSAYAWELKATRDSGAVSFQGTPGGWEVKIGSDTFSGTAPLNFSASVSTIVIATNTTNYFNHAADGTLNLPVQGFHTIGLFGDALAAGTFATDPISRLPTAPGKPTVSNLTTTTAKVDWTAPTDQGSGSFVGYEVWWATNSAFTEGVQSKAVVDGSRTTTLTGLTPGLSYWVRERLRTSVGLGPYSASTSFKPSSGIQVSDGTTWKPADLTVDAGSEFRSAVVYQSDGTAWKAIG
jgi:hypothetical protein